MKSPVVVKVRTRQEQKDFIRLPYLIYKDSPQYVPDLDKDIRALLNQQPDPIHDSYQIQPFVAYRQDVAVGRIVGIVNRKANERWQQRCVRFSLIEFVDDPSVSAALLDAVAAWGRDQEMDTIEGPMGITDFDKEGMLVEDFHLLGSMNTLYNPDYYPRHMESLGFSKAVDWLQLRINIPAEVPVRYSRTAAYVREQIGLQVIKLSDDDIRHRGYGRKVFDLLNIAYRPIFGFSEMSPAQADSFIDKYLRLIDKALIPVVVNKDDEVVGVAVTMCSLSQAMQKAHGRLWPMGWWHLLNALHWHHADNAEMLLVAVHPDYQGLGVNALFFDDLIPVYNRYGIRWAETGPQLETNVRELSQWKPLKPEFVKRRRCFIKTI